MSEKEVKCKGKRRKRKGLTRKRKKSNEESKNFWRDKERKIIRGSRDCWRSNKSRRGENKKGRRRKMKRNCMNWTISRLRI